MIGLYYLPIPLLCHELGMEKEGATKALERLSKGMFCAYDAPSETIFVRTMARYQLGERLKKEDNRILGIEKLLSQVKNSPFYNDFLDIYAESYHLNLPRITKPLPSPLGGGLFIEQDQEQDQEQEKDKKKEMKSATAGHSNGSWPSAEAFIALYNTHTPEDHPKVTVLSPQRRKKVDEYVHLFPEQDFWLKVYEEVCASPFLLGQKSSKDRRAVKRGLDWLLQKGEDGLENCVKTYEGKYRDSLDDRLRSRMSDREYRSIKAAQRFLENTDATPGQTPICHPDEDIIDHVQYRIN